MPEAARTKMTLLLNSIGRPTFEEEPVARIKCLPTALPFSHDFGNEFSNGSAMHVVRHFRTYLEIFKFMKAVIIFCYAILGREKRLGDTDLVGNKQAVCQKTSSESFRNCSNRKVVWVGKHYTSPFLVITGVAIEILEFDVVHGQNLRVQEYHFVVVPEEVSLGRESARQRDGRIIEAQ